MIKEGPSNQSTGSISSNSEMSFSTSSNARHRWCPTNTTKIKTEQGSIIADIDIPSAQSNSTSRCEPLTAKEPVLSAWSNHVVELNVEQSWMPNWVREKSQPTAECEYESDFEDSSEKEEEEEEEEAENLLSRVGTLKGEKIFLLN